jgi:predicted ATP-binding protein involved in virulence
VKRDELILELPDRSLPFSCLSDGFRNMVAMVADIAVRCATLNPQLAAEAALQTPGVVLVDEIDLHLHPKWQRRVVGDLLAAFPNIQFIATTHSPFVIQSLPPVEGVQLINLDNADAEDFANKSVEDIAEDLQGVENPQRSKRWQDMMEAAEEYYAVLRDAKGKSPEEVALLKNRLDELSLPFSDDPAYQALLVSERVAAGLNGEGH